MGFVGLGSVSCSLNTTPLDDLSDFRIRLLPLNIELCDTPVEGALSIKDAAQGVAVCKTGLLINGLDVVCTAGSVDDFGNDEFEVSPMFDKLGTVVVLVKGICSPSTNISTTSVLSVTLPEIIAFAPEIL